jgi:hypothetical protein
MSLFVVSTVSSEYITQLTTFVSLNVILCGLYVPSAFPMSFLLGYAQSLEERAANAVFYFEVLPSVRVFVHSYPYKPP